MSAMLVSCDKLIRIESYVRMSFRRPLEIDQNSSCQRNQDIIAIFYDLKICIWFQRLEKPQIET